jgi:GAF domain-containing protein
MAEASPDASDARLGIVLAGFARSVADVETAGEIVEELIRHITDLLPVVSVGLLIRGSDGRLEVGTAAPDVGRLVEELEVRLAEGPCSDSLCTGRQVSVPDLATEAERWPQFVPPVLDAGVRSIHALPMATRGEPFGVLDLIALEPTELDGWHLSTGQLLADVAASYLANARALRESTRLNEQLQRALDRRVLIEQAKGVLAERHGIGIGDAFERMRQFARDRNLQLRDVAVRVIRGDLSP